MFLCIIELLKVEGYPLPKQAAYTRYTGDFCCAGLQWVLLVNSIFCAVFAAAVEARRLLLAVAFQTQYGDRINFPRALTAPTHGIRRTFVHWFAGPKAWTNVQPLEQADA